MTPPPWPQTINLLESTEIRHGIYSNACGTVHCAVGAVAEAFGVSPYPDRRVWNEELRQFIEGDRDGWAEDGQGGVDTVAPEGSPMHRFARRFAIELGADKAAFDRDYADNGLRALETVFENGEHRKDERPPTKKETADAFNRAVRKSGYTRTLNR